MARTGDKSRRTVDKSRELAEDFDDVDLDSLTPAQLAELERMEEEEEEEEESPYTDKDLERAFQLDAAPTPVVRVSKKHDPELDLLNDPDVVQLGEVTQIGGKGGTTDIFGSVASTSGRSTSPKLYASASKFPTAVQFRVWRMENGIPTALGVIDTEATEEDFVRRFFSAMPSPGDGKFQYRLRPIDDRGRELGQEIPYNISEHHAELARIREVKKREAMEAQEGPFGGGFGRGWGRNGFGGGGGDVVVQPSDSGAAAAEEMGRMFDTAIEAAQQQTAHLQQQIDIERERMRIEEQRRAEERVALAERAAQTTEKTMERVMATDRLRSEEAIKAQQQYSDVLMKTMATSFAQHQEAAREQAERFRQMDEQRMRQDREFFDRQRMEAEERRRADREEWERKRVAELEQIRLDSERRERELQARLEREKLEIEQKKEQARAERDAALQEMKERREREVMDWQSKLQREKEEREEKYRFEREERERRDAIERDARERRDRAEREEREAREKREREDKERDREERNARAEAERARWEREKLEWERKESLRREELQREADRRRDELVLQQKQMEIQAQRDREHSEAMAKQAALEREIQREAMERREKAEREAREEAERQRQRQHELEMLRLDKQANADREHQERMLQLSRIEKSGGFSALTDTLGMDTKEVLSRIFGKKDEDGEEGGAGWMESAAAVLGPIFEMGRMVMEQRAQQAPKPVSGGNKPQMVQIQTPDGPRMISMDELQALQAQINARNAVVVNQQGAQVPRNGDPRRNGAQSNVAGGNETRNNETHIHWEGPIPELPSDEVSTSAPETPSGTQVRVNADSVAPSDSTSLAKAAGLKLKDIKAARKGLRALAQALPKAAEEEYEGIIAAAIMTTPSIIGYIQAVSLLTALEETKSDPELIEKAMSTIRASNFVEPGFPFTPADLTPKT